MTTPSSTPTRLRLGFLPLLDCASLVVAAEKGFAAAEGLELELVRENSWATLRDRLIVGQFDAAHLLGPMPIASTLGVGHLKVPLIAPMALGLGGNAITVSSALWQAMCVHGASPSSAPAVQGRALERVVRERAARPTAADAAAAAHGAAAPLTFAMVHPFSAHNYELRYWLAACGIDPDEDVTLVVIPPPFMVDALRAGQIDGYCVGEPWNSLAAAATGPGVIVTPTTAIWRLSPEKVLGLRADWAEKNLDTTLALIRAVHAAACWCDQPHNRGELAALLAQPRYVGAAAEIIQQGLSGSLIFADHDATFPWISHAAWFYSQMVRWRQIQASPAAEAAARATYRPDLYREALAPLRLPLPAADTKLEPGGANHAADAAFFDGQPFDADDLQDYWQRTKIARPR
jgi:NitT/TauT family transport system ATP-binding protein